MAFFTESTAIVWLPQTTSVGKRGKIKCITPQSEAYSDFNVQFHLPWKIPQLSMEFTMSTAIYQCFFVHFCWLRLKHILLTDYLGVTL